MSDDLPRQHRSGAWSLYILAGVLLAYVASWPPVQIRVTSRAAIRFKPYSPFTIAPGPTVTIRTGGTAVKHHMAPQWVDVFYYPLNRLRFIYQRRNPLNMYYLFWEKRL